MPSASPGVSTAARWKFPKLLTSTAVPGTFATISRPPVVMLAKARSSPTVTAKSWANARGSSAVGAQAKVAHIPASRTARLQQPASHSFESALSAVLNIPCGLSAARNGPPHYVPPESGGISTLASRNPWRKQSFASSRAKNCLANVTQAAYLRWQVA